VPFIADTVAAACLHWSDKEALFAFKQAIILPPPAGTLEQNFCASALQPARSSASAAASSAYAG
jgi:hypothetical protein